MGRKIEVKETVNKIFNFCQAIFAPPSKLHPWHVPYLPYPRYASGNNTKVFFPLITESHDNIYSTTFPLSVFSIF